MLRSDQPSSSHTQEHRPSVSCLDCPVPAQRKVRQSSAHIGWPRLVPQFASFTSNEKAGTHPLVTQRQPGGTLVDRLQPDIGRWNLGSSSPSYIATATISTAVCRRGYKQHFKRISVMPSDHTFGHFNSNKEPQHEPRRVETGRYVHSLLWSRYCGSSAAISPRTGTLRDISRFFCSCSADNR